MGAADLPPSSGAQAVIHPGDTASFTITVSNVTASAAANVVVTDQLPAAGLLSWGASSGSFTTSTKGIFVYDLR